jgi:hypothetical protein
MLATLPFTLVRMRPVPVAVVAACMLATFTLGLVLLVPSAAVVARLLVALETQL